MPNSTECANAVFRDFHAHRGGNGGVHFHASEAYDDSHRCKSADHSSRVLETILPRVPESYLGAHVVTARFGYLHHGIYVGGGLVVHYAGFGKRLRRGPVEEVPVADFTRNRPAWVIPTRAVFNGQEVVDRARSRLGENCYRLWTNNCEHFCEWCLRGEHRSFQVERWRHRLTRSASARLFGA
jgi:hypothetical protein